MASVVLIGVLYVFAMLCTPTMVSLSSVLYHFLHCSNSQVAIIQSL